MSLLRPLMTGSRTKALKYDDCFGNLFPARGARQLPESSFELSPFRKWLRNTMFVITFTVLPILFAGYLFGYSVK